MVIAPGTNGITAHVILGDDEALPEKFNSEKVVVYRRGKSTDLQLVLLKPLGVLLEVDALRKLSNPVCNFEGGTNPLHEHADGTFWFYEETWVYENGPFPTYDDAYNALAEYCVGLETAKQTVIEMENERLHDHLTTNLEGIPAPNVEAGMDNRDSQSVVDVPADREVADGVED